MASIYVTKYWFSKENLKMDPPVIRWSENYEVISRSLRSFCWRTLVNTCKKVLHAATKYSIHNIWVVYELCHLQTCRPVPKTRWWAGPFSGFHWEITSNICYINGHHTQYILVGTMFNHIFHLGLPGTCLYLSPQDTPFSAGARKVYFPDLFKDIVLEVQNQKCS